MPVSFWSSAIWPHMLMGSKFFATFSWKAEISAISLPSAQTVPKVPFITREPFSKAISKPPFYR